MYNEQNIFIRLLSMKLFDRMRNATKLQQCNITLTTNNINNRKYFPQLAVVFVKEKWRTKSNGGMLVHNYINNYVNELLKHKSSFVKVQNVNIPQS